MVEPYPEGTLVHHCGAIHSLGQDPGYPSGDGTLRGGWAKVVGSVKQSDGTFEYEVRRHRGIAGTQREIPEHGELTWWGSHHIDRAVDPKGRRQ